MSSSQPTEVGPVEPGGPQSPARQSPVTGHRSPIALAVAADGHRVLTANHRSDSVSLVDLRSGSRIAECRCGRGPVDVVWLDQRNAVVSLLHDDALAVLEVRDKQLHLQRTIPVGDEPRGLAAIASDVVWVALCGEDRIACVDITRGTVRQKVAVGGHPRAVAVTADKRWLVTSCNSPGEVLVHDAADQGRIVDRHEIFDTGFNVGAPTVLPDGSAVLVPSLVNRTFTVTADHIGKGWVMDNRLNRFPLPRGEPKEQRQLGLDIRGDAAGDVHAVAVSPRSDWMAVTCAGSHEVLLLNRRQIPWPPSNPGDVLLPELEADEQSFFRMELGGRPLDVEFVGEHRLLIANDLQDSLQLINIADRKLLQSIHLGGPKSPDAVHRGAAIFYDADRSHHSWFSCHSCHRDGHTSGQIWDTLNDDSVDTFKLTPTLRGVTQTGPWTWHGWQKSLARAMHKSVTDTLNGPRPLSPSETRDLLTFLQSLHPPTSPHRTPAGGLTPAAQRGQRLFHGRSGCAACHPPPLFTSPQTYDVGLGSFQDVFEGYNPPSLRGLHARRRFLHDGRATRLEQLLLRHHRPQDLGGEPLSSADRRDLIAYLRSL